MRAKKVKIFLAAAAVGIFLGAVPAAAENDEVNGKTDENIEELSEDTQQPVTKKPEVTAEYYKDFQYSSDVVLSGIYGTNSYYFQIPDYWNTEYVYAGVQVSLSSLIQDVPASLTFMVNNTPVTSYAMDYQSGKDQIFYVEIPVSMLKEGYNSFDITGYVRLYDENGCIDDMSNANWISISKNSFIQCGYSLKDTQNEISSYPYPFISTVDESGSNTYVVVPDEATEQELEAGLMLRADLGNETGDKDEIFLVKESDLPSSLKNSNILVVSSWENLSDTWKEDVQGEADGQDMEKQALVANRTDEGGNQVLVITSENKDCLLEAVSMLMDKDRVEQENQDTAFVKEGSAALAMADTDEEDTAAGRYTLKNLAGGGLSFEGPFHQESSVYLPFSGGYVLANAGKIDLQFRYSENLDFNRSMITVYWGDVPVASKKLTKENAGGDTLSFTMPEDVIGTYAGSIKIAFDLELQDLFCTPRMDQMPWAYVSEDSALYLPTGQAESYTFSERPYPFEISSNFNNLLVVVPDEMTATELQTLGLIVSRYGENLSPYGKIQVKTASEAEEMEKKEYNIIVIGNGDDNGMLEKINENLSFQYSEDKKSFLSNQYLVLSDTYAASLGTLQLIASPYDDSCALLAVAALDDDTMENVGECLATQEGLAKLEKDTVLIDGEGEVKTFQVGKKSGVKAEPILKKVFTEQRETAIFVLVSVGVMLLLLLAVILILIRSYMHGRRS